MPKGVLMDQISRPFQIALVAVGLLAAVWLFALHGRSSSTPEASSTAPASAPATSASAASASTPAAEEKAAAAPSKVYNGSAPGVKGLSSAIAKAHKAVATSQRNASELQSKSDQASSTSVPVASTAAPAAAPVTKTSTSVTVSKGNSSHTTTVTKVLAGAPAGQRAVESELAKGNVVVVLFWNPAGSDDRAVHAELRLLEAVHDRLRAQDGNAKVRALVRDTGLQLTGKIAVQEALPGQVTSFGSITRGVQVNQTPTLLVINKHGQAITLTGLQDAYAIEQAIDEVRAA
jgi:hypothetical protein